MSAPVRVACLSLSPSPMALQLAESFSPRIQAEENGFYLDLGRPRDEEGLAQSIVRRAHQQRLHACVGIASNKRVAQLAARLAHQGPIIVPVGQEKAFLAPLTLDLLKPSEALARTLERWGVHTLGDLARLPADEMITHLGKEGWELHQAANGIDLEPFVPFERTPVFLEKIDFGWSLYELEPFMLAAQPLFDRLVRQLSLSGLACQTLELGLQLEPHGEERRSIRLRAPTQEVKTLLRLVRTHLAAQPPAAPLAGLTLIARPELPREAQLTLFGPASLSPVHLAATMAQLAALLGEERIGSPVSSEGYRPERFALQEYDPPPPPLLREEAVPSATPAPLTAIRVLRPPLRLEVVQAEAWPAEPLRLRSVSGGWEAKVRAAAGPWRLEDRWWSDDGLWRDYWDVELADGALYRIFQDRPRGSWYADGLYD